MDWEAYKLGQKHCKKVDGEMRGYENPYDEGTESYISYRKGWNEYWEESWGRQRRAKAESLINVDCMECGKSKSFCECED
jgi:hypothetical protein